jgi:hypothetical protein
MLLFLFLLLLFFFVCQVVPAILAELQLLLDCVAATSATP